MGHGGLRYGAGRKGHRAKVERTPGIDVRQWKRDGMLRPGSSGVWRWQNGEAVAWLADDGVVRLGTIGRDGGPVQQLVALAHVPCSIGGQRALFICPGCRRRAALLYLGAAGMACRRCLGLIYSSQCASAPDSAWRRAGLVPAGCIIAGSRGVGSTPTAS